MNAYLKIKIKSLSAEQIIIRQQKAKQFGYVQYLRRTNKKGVAAADSVREGLHNHSQSVVSKATRHTLLAYGFLRGRDYSVIEKYVRKNNLPNWEEVERMVRKYGVDDIRHRMQKFSQWVDEAHEQYKEQHPVEEESNNE